MPNTDIQLVCLDLGGVILRLADGWDDTLRRAGVLNGNFDREVLRDPQVIETTHQFERGEIGNEAEYTEKISRLSGLTPEQVLAVIDAILVEPYAGVDAMFDALDKRAVQTACLSNTNMRHWRTVTTPGPLFLPLDRLHHRFASHLIGHRKPVAAAYQHVQDQTGVGPEAILFFDDLPENIDSATKQGWQAQRIDPHNDPVGQVMDHLRSHGVL